MGGQSRSTPSSSCDAHGDIGLVTLGLVFLVVTGGEALYADLGHFGRKPIQRAWFGLVLPALIINYFGQGALVLANPAAIENPFYRLVPEMLLLPMVVLATAATVIASQAVITGAYSLVHQAIQLGMLPRLAILHTSASQAGQIYIPRVTAMLFIGVLLLVGVFKTLERARLRLRHRGRHHHGGRRPAWRSSWCGSCGTGRCGGSALVIAPLVVVDVTFFSANLLKLLEGAWAPLLFGVAHDHADDDVAARHQPADAEDATQRGAARHPARRASRRSRRTIVPGTAVFLTSEPEFAPTALLHNLKHNKVLHEHNVILTIITTDTPRVSEDERVKITPVSPHFSRVALKFGYMEQPNVPKALAVARKQGWHFDIMSTSFFLSRRALKPAAHSGMPRWQDRLFIGLAKSASDATDFFQIPTGRVVEVGTQVTV